MQSKETNPGPFKVDQTTLVWILLTHSQMEECLSVFVIQFLTSQLMLNLVQRSVQMWLTESGTEPGRHLWLTLTWWRLLELTHPDDQSEWENHTQVNGCHERRSCWLSSEWKSLKCEVCGLLAITPCFFFSSAVLLFEYSATNTRKLFPEENSACGKVRAECRGLWRSPFVLR